MAVYERKYRRYTGEMGSALWRFSVIPRYVFKDVFKSKLLTAFFALCFGPPILFGAMIYLRHNAQFLEAFPDFPLTEILVIDAGFFENLMIVQRWLAFFVALFIGPGLVSRDLANNALPLYLSRPISRAEYVLGKFSVLAVLLSAITWGAGGLLYVLQSNFAGWDWMVANLRVALAMLIGSATWIVVISLMALALSAWVRWRPVAGFMMLMMLLAGAAFATMINILFHTDWGHVINLTVLMEVVWSGLFGVETASTISPFVAACFLAAYCFFFLYLLDRKIRAYEVVS